jgi:hypothetical protein
VCYVVMNSVLEVQWAGTMGCESCDGDYGGDDDRASECESKKKSVTIMGKASRALSNDEMKALSTKVVADSDATLLFLFKKKSGKPAGRENTRERGDLRGPERIGTGLGFPIQNKCYVYANKGRQWKVKGEETKEKSQAT